MGAEILLYGYGLVCLSMLVFNLPAPALRRPSAHPAGGRAPPPGDGAAAPDGGSPGRALPAGAGRPPALDAPPPLPRQLSGGLRPAAGRAGGAGCGLSGLHPAAAARVPLPVPRLPEAGEHAGRLLLPLSGQAQAAPVYGDGSGPAGHPLLSAQGQPVLQNQRPQGAVQLRQPLGAGGCAAGAGGRAGEPAARKGGHGGAALLYGGHPGPDPAALVSPG